MTAANVIYYQIHEVIPYINWIYFFHAWGFQPRYADVAHTAVRDAWQDSFPLNEHEKAQEAIRLYSDAQTVLKQLEGTVTVNCLYRLCQAYSDGDNLLLDGTCFPLLRQQASVKTGKQTCLCLSDFVRPLSSGIPDRVGLFASSISTSAEQDVSHDPYRLLLIQTLNDRLVEAGTERMHQHIRKTVWGYAPDESLSIPDILRGKFQGIRPAVGYPSLPDQSVIFLLDALLDMKRIGISLTENGAMHPHASTSGLIFAHPEACYFSVGQIGDDQLADYAQRRHLPVERIRQFLSTNIHE